MSIEQNGSGFLDLSSGVITSGDYTILVYVKLNTASNFDTVLTYDNTSSDFVKIQHWGTDFRGDLDQQFTNQVTGGAVVANSWQRVILSSESTSNNPRIVVDGTGVTSGGQTGTFQTNVSPNLRLFGNDDDSRILPNGAKIGLVAIWNAQLDATDESFLDGGGDPSDLPSATAPTEVWLDTQGIALDGSNDLITWTGINASVLTASGSLREDDTDMAPVTLAGSTTEATTTVEFLPDTGFSHQLITTTTASLDDKDWSFGLTNLKLTDRLVTRDADSSFVTHNPDGTSTATSDGTSKVFTRDATDGALTEINLTYDPASGPVLTSPTGVATGTTTASGTVSTDTANGTLYYLASENSSELLATVKAGSSQGVSTAGVQNVSITGLTEKTSYYIHYVHTDSGANDSSVSSSAQFTTVDATSPILSSPTGTPTGGTTADGTVSTDEGEGTLYFIATQNSIESVATVKAGNSQAVSATGVQNVSVTGLTSEVSYYMHYVQTDNSSNDSLRVSSAQFTTDDTNAPVLSSPTGTPTGSTTADGTVVTDEGNGTLYFIATQNATETVGTVKAGDSQAVSATGVQNISVTGLTENTSYYMHYVHTDVSLNDSTRVSSVQFSTFDLTPDAFSFTDVTNQEPTTQIESDEITVTGITAGQDVAISITGGEYAVNTGAGFGAFTSAPTTVQLNYDVKVRHLTSSSFSANTDTVLTIGGVNDTFRSTTRAEVAPTIAATRNVNGIINQAFSVQLVITSGDAPTSWNITGGADQAEYSITAGGILSRDINNDTVEQEVVQVTATNGAGTSGTQTVTIDYLNVDSWPAGSGSNRYYGCFETKDGETIDGATFPRAYYKKL